MLDSAETVISVDVTHEEDLAADGFDLLVSVRGSSLVTGSAAFEKAAEVKALVGAVVAQGIEREDVSLAGVQVDVESGLLSKSSSARYALRIRSHDVARLADVLSSIASAKNGHLERLEWRHPEGEEPRKRWLRAAVEKARGRADAMAGGLGLVVTGVRRVVTPVPGASPSLPRAAPAMHGPPASPAPAMRRRANEIDLGLDVAPTKRVRIDVQVEFTARGHP